MDLVVVRKAINQAIWFGLIAKEWSPDTSHKESIKPGKSNSTSISPRQLWQEFSKCVAGFTLIPPQYFQSVLWLFRDNGKFVILGKDLVGSIFYSTDHSEISISIDPKPPQTQLKPKAWSWYHCCNPIARTSSEHVSDRWILYNYQDKCMSSVLGHSLIRDQSLKLNRIGMNRQTGNIFFVLSKQRKRKPLARRNNDSHWKRDDWSQPRLYQTCRRAIFQTFISQK